MGLLFDVTAEDDAQKLAFHNALNELRLAAGEAGDLGLVKISSRLKRMVKAFESESRWFWEDSPAEEYQDYLKHAVGDDSRHDAGSGEPPVVPDENS
jgi:hypothetical protein